MTHQEAIALAPGWYADPWDEGVLVWWNGESWGPRAPMTTVDPVLPVAPLSAPHDDVPHARPRLEPVTLPSRALRCRACGQASRTWEGTCVVCGVRLPHGDARPEHPATTTPFWGAWWTPAKVVGLVLAVVLGASAVVAVTSPGDYNAGYVWGTGIVEDLHASPEHLGDGDGDLAEEIGTTCSSAAYGDFARGSAPVAASDPAVWEAGCIAGMKAAAGLG